MLDCKPVQKARADIVCLTLKVGDVWKQVQELAADNSRSVSSYLRELIKETYKRNKKKNYKRALYRALEETEEKLRSPL